MIKVISAVLLFVSISLAGVRTVGNGGGFGEMKAYLAFQQMGRQIRLCFTVASVCSLTTEQKKLLEQVLTSLERERGGVQFFNDSTLVRTVETAPQVGSPVLINSNLLTESTGIAATFEKITGYVLYGLLQHQKSDMSPSELWQLSVNVFSNFRESNFTSNINIGGFYHQLHHMQVLNIQDSSLIYDGLLVEDSVKTVDLLAETDLMSLCPNKSNFYAKIKSLNPGPSNGDLTVLVSWSCDSENWGEAILYFSMSINRDYEINLPIPNAIRGLVRPFPVIGG
jgi:hypothetical protein